MGGVIPTLTDMLRSILEPTVRWTSACWLTGRARFLLTRFEAMRPERRTFRAVADSHCPARPGNAAAVESDVLSAINERLLSARRAGRWSSDESARAL